MKIRILALMLMIGASLMCVNAKVVFSIDGPEKYYNQIRVVNETSQDSVRCRLVVLKEDDSRDYVYGVYNLKGKDDSDTNTKKLTRGTRVAIEMPKDFDGEVSYTLEYLDLPLFDIVVVHLQDKNSEFNEE